MTRSLIRQTAVVALVLGAAALAACGGSDETVTPGETLASDASVIAAAPAVGAPPSGLSADSPGAPALAAGESAPGTGSGSGGSFDLLGRQIIRNGAIDLEVDSVADAFEQVSAIATAAGGFVAESSFFGRTGEDGDQQSARLTLRVPADQFDAVVSELRIVGAEVVSVSVSSQDITGQVTDLQSELRSLLAVEARYLELLNRAESIGDILTVQDRLNLTRSQIDRTQGRMQLLEGLADLATISVALRPVPVPPAPMVDEGGGPFAAAQDAWQASLNTLTAIATVALVVVVYSWWLVPVLALAALLARRFAPAWPALRPSRPVD